jgi:hypothetical protein
VGKKLAILAHLCLISSLVITGCGIGPEGSSDPVKAEATKEFVYPDYDEYRSLVILPTEVGTEWTYAIKSGNVDPLRYREIVWPMDNGKAAVYRNLEYFPVLATSSDRRKVFYLTLRVSGKPSRQGPFEYRDAVELEIVKDDLGVYEGAKQVFWLTPPGYFENMVVYGGTEVSEVVTYPSALAPGDFTQEDGFSIRYILLHQLPGTTEQHYVWGEGQNERLRSLMPTKQFSPYEGKWIFHYQRVVDLYEGAIESATAFPNGFVEDAWYAPAVGLVRLEQKVNNKLSMTWILEKFSGSGK